MIYFDHSATTRPYPEVTDTVSKVMNDFYGNPSSIHHLGMEAEKLLNKSRETVASLLHVPAETIIFTSGGTESNNLAVLGTAWQYKQRGMHLITSVVEHPSVYECFKHLEQQGFQVTYLPVDHKGAVQLEDLKNAMTDETILVSIMHVNNEVGSVQPIAQIGQWLKQHPRVFFHVDAVQSVGKLEIDPIEMGIDLLSVSGHKFNGPRGVGVLYKRNGMKLTPLLFGGGQEYGYRSGTENLPAIVGFAKALRLTMQDMKTKRDYLGLLRKALISELNQAAGIQLNGSDIEAEMAPHIVNVSFAGMKAEVIVHWLEQRGIYVSTKSACASSQNKPSRILLAMGCDQAHANSGIRISLSAQHTLEDIHHLARALIEAATVLKPMMGVKS